MSDADDRDSRLKSLRSRVRDELVEGGIVEKDEEIELEFDADEDSTTLSDRIARRRRRMKRTKERRRRAAMKAVEEGGDPAVLRLPAVLRERSEDEWVLNLAVLLIIIGSVIGAASGLLLISSDPRDLVSSSVFLSNDDAEVHGLVLSELDTENSTGGDGLDGVDVELIRVSDDHSEGRTETNSEGRFTISEVSREAMLLRVEMEGYVTI